MGAILGGAGEATATEWATIGLEFGIAFQMQDDLIPYRHRGVHSGKDSTTDIRNGRITLPWLIAASTAVPRDRQLLCEIQRMALRGDAELPINAVQEILGAPENLARCERVVERHVHAALSALTPFKETGGGAAIYQMLTDSVGRAR
jgi:geranylgeranyl diphosphate synthase type I